MALPAPALLPGFDQRRLHHVGFVVSSIIQSADDFGTSLHCTWDGALIVDPIQKVRVAFLTLGCAGQPMIELVEPDREDSPVSAFLKRGPGLHHLCYEVSDLEAELSRCQTGMVLGPPVPAVAFGGRRIAWVYTKTRLLLEYLER